MGAGAEAQSCFRNSVKHSANGGRRPAGRHCSCELPGARRLFAMAHPIHGTLAETYLRNRGIAALHNIGALPFHPRCYYCADYGSTAETWPGMIACVTDLRGRFTGAYRTWLDPGGFDPIRLGKAPIATPRRAMGDLLGNTVRFGIADDILAAGEGIEAVLSLRCGLHHQYVRVEFPTGACVSDPGAASGRKEIQFECSAAKITHSTVPSKRTCKRCSLTRELPPQTQKKGGEHEFAVA
jgi:hypothetical protein